MSCVRVPSCVGFVSLLMGWLDRPCPLPPAGSSFLLVTPYAPRDLSATPPIQELISLCTQWPEEPLSPAPPECPPLGAANTPDKRLYKYPFVASEVLCADVPRIQDAMTRSPEPLYSVLSALDTAPAGRMETMRATYVVKVVGALLRSRSTVVLAHLASRARPDLVTSLLRQLALAPVADLLVRLLDPPPPPPPPPPAFESLDTSAVGWGGLCLTPEASIDATPTVSTVPMAALQLLARADVLGRLVGVIAEQAVPVGTPTALTPALGGDGGGDGGGGGAGADGAAAGRPVEGPDDRRVREATLAHASLTLLDLSRELLQLRASGVAIPDPLNVFGRGDLCGQLLDAGLTASAAGHSGALHIALDTLGRLLTTPANVPVAPAPEESPAAADGSEDDLFDWDGSGSGGGAAFGDDSAAAATDQTAVGSAPVATDGTATTAATAGSADLAGDPAAALLPPPPRLVSTAAVEAVLIARLPALMALVVDDATQAEDPPSGATELTAPRPPPPPPSLGMTRLMVIELLCALFALGGEEAVSALVGVGVPGLLLRRFSTHQWSSMLHTTVTDAVVALLSTGRPYAHRALFAGGFVPWLVATWTSGEAASRPAGQSGSASGVDDGGSPGQVDAPEEKTSGASVAEAQADVAESAVDPDTAMKEEGRPSPMPTSSPSGEAMDVDAGGGASAGAAEPAAPDAAEDGGEQGPAAGSDRGGSDGTTATPRPPPTPSSNTTNAEALRAAGGVASFRPGYMGHLIQLFVALGGFIDKLTAGSPAVGGGDAAADHFAEAGLTPADVAAVKELMDSAGGVGAALRVQQKALCGERPDGSDANRSEGEEDEDLYEDATPLFDMNEVIHSLTLPDNAVHINRFAARLMSQSGVNASDLLGEDEEEATPVGGVSGTVAHLAIDSDEDVDSDDNSAYSTPDAYADDEGEAAVTMDGAAGPDADVNGGDGGGDGGGGDGAGGVSGRVSGGVAKMGFAPIDAGVPWPPVPGVGAVAPPPPLDAADVGVPAPPPAQPPLVLAAAAVVGAAGPPLAPPPPAAAATGDTPEAAAGGGDHATAPAAAPDAAGPGVVDAAAAAVAVTAAAAAVAAQATPPSSPPSGTPDGARPPRECHRVPPSSSAPPPPPQPTLSE